MCCAGRARSDLVSFLACSLNDMFCNSKSERKNRVEDSSLLIQVSSIAAPRNLQFFSLILFFFDGAFCKYGNKMLLCGAYMNTTRSRRHGGVSFAYILCLPDFFVEWPLFYKALKKFALMLANSLTSRLISF